MEVMAGLACALFAFIIGYTLGHMQGVIEGACEEACGEETAGMGSFVVKGMACQCVYPEKVEDSAS